MDQEPIYDPNDTVEVFQDRLLVHVHVKDAEIFNNLQSVEACKETYSTGIDRLTGIGWMYLQSNLFLYKDSDTSFKKYYINFMDLSRHTEIIRTRPIFYTQNSFSFGIFTNGKDLIATPIFGQVSVRTKMNLAQMAFDETILQFSHLVRIPNSARAFFVLMTSRGSLHLCELSPGTQGGIEITPSQLSSSSAVESSFLGSALKSMFRRVLPKEIDLVRAKLLLSLRDSNTCSLTVFASSDESSPRPKSILQSLVISTSPPKILRTHNFLLSRIGSYIIDIVDDVCTHVFLVEDNDRCVRLISTKHDGKIETIDKEEVVFKRRDQEEDRAYGRVVRHGDQVWVVLKAGKDNIVFRTDDPDWKKFQKHEVKGEVVGVDVDGEEGIRVFTNRTVFAAVSDRRGSGKKMDEERKLSGVSRSATSRSGEEEADLRLVEDIIKTGFNEYYVERTTGYIQKIVGCSAESLGEIVRRLVWNFSEELSSNLTLYEYIRQQGKQGQNRPRKDDQDLILFDINQRKQKVEKFKVFLENNRILDQLTQKDRLCFLQAEEALSSLGKFRIVEKRVSDRGNKRADDFSNSIQHSVASSHSGTCEIQRFYSKPYYCWKAINYLLSLCKPNDNNTHEDLLELISSIFFDIQQCRKKAGHDSRLNPLPSTWWIHSGSFLLVSVQEFYKNFTDRYLESDLFRKLALDFSLSLIKEIQTILHEDPESISYSSFSRVVYDTLIRNRLEKEAHRVASETENWAVAAEILVRHNMKIAYVNIKDVVECAGQEYFSHIMKEVFDKIETRGLEKEECRNAMAVLGCAIHVDRVMRFVEENRPSLVWMFYTARGQPKEALETVDYGSGGDLVTVGFKKILEGLECQERTVDEEEIHFAYITRKLPLAVRRAKPQVIVDYIIESRDIKDKLRVKWALIFGLKNYKKYDQDAPLFARPLTLVVQGMRGNNGLGEVVLHLGVLRKIAVKMGEDYVADVFRKVLGLQLTEEDYENVLETEKNVSNL